MENRPVSEPMRDAANVLATADEIFSAEEVRAAFDRLAREITDDLAEANPVVLAVMTGGVVPAVRLQCRFNFLHQLDYVHATRYRGGTHGGELEWLARPRTPLKGRTVLIVDDILDEGATLAAIQQMCREAGAHRVCTAVLTLKLHDRRVPGVSADYVGLEVPDRYVFGAGMDYGEYLRNVNGIFALAAREDE